MAIKSRSYIIYLDGVRLSLGIFFFSELFNGEFLLSGSSFIFGKNTHQKAAHYLMFGLNLPVAMNPAWFLGMQFRALDLI